MEISPGRSILEKRSFEDIPGRLPAAPHCLRALALLLRTLGPGLALPRRRDPLADDIPALALGDLPQERLDDGGVVGLSLNGR